MLLTLDVCTHMHEKLKDVLNRLPLFGDISNKEYNF